MGRPKTITDEEILAVARAIFRTHGHSASTRTIADAARISEAILYQRFGSKDDLFFAAMHATGPDIANLLGPKEPAEDVRTYLRTVVVRMGKYFADVIPVALRVMTHPSFDPATLARVQPRGHDGLRQGLAERLAFFKSRKQIALESTAVVAQLLVGLAHDWALGNVLAHKPCPPGARDLRQMVDVIWEGLRVR